MPFKILVSALPSYDVTVYSRAGDFPNNEYNLFYSDDGINFTYLAGPLSSTSCTQLSTVTINSGTIYIKAVDDFTSNQVYIRGANSSTCPANLDVICTYSVAISGTEDVAITVYVDGSGDYRSCT
jgi:hypothetical protein